MTTEQILITWWGVFSVVLSYAVDRLRYRVTQLEKRVEQLERK